MTKPYALRQDSVRDEPLDIRVCNISFRRNDEHEALCVRVIRSRSHPKWSRSHSEFRVVHPKLRRVR
jgi:hypothetical protein